MRKFYYLILSVFILSCSFYQDPVQEAYNKRLKFYLDENGKRIKRKDFLKKWTEKERIRWDYTTKDSGRVAKLYGSKYSGYIVSYATYKSKIEKITGRTFREGVTFLLHYTYKDDLCSSYSTNHMTKEAISESKYMTLQWQEVIQKEHQDIVYLNFYDEEIKLHNDLASPEEYYFTDTGNFLKTSIFLFPSLCGSFALIKPNGQVLVRNGEASPYFMAEHSKPQNWKIFFPETTSTPE